MTTSINAYKTAVADKTEAARVAFDRWEAASKQYERTGSLMDYEALKVAHKTWQDAVKKWQEESGAYADWYMLRKHNRGAQ